MSQIVTELIEDLSKEIARAFTINDLEMIMLTTTGRGLFQFWVPQGLHDQKTAFDLLQAIDRSGDARAVLANMLARRPHNDELARIIDRACPEARQAVVPTSQQVATLVTGLAELRARLGAPEVRARLAQSLATLQKIVETTEQLHAYKSLHECLHQLQAKQFRALRDAVRSLPDQPQQIPELLAYRFQLAAACISARGSVVKLPDLLVIRATENMWIDVLEAAGMQFHDAIDNADIQAARRALDRIRSIMVIDPPRLNRLIFTTATALPLDDLMSALRDAGGEAVPEIRAALASLHEIAATIRIGVGEHRDWQDADMQIVDIERLLEGDRCEDFTFAWLDLKPLVQRLADRDPAAKWAEKIRLYIDNVDDLLALELKTIDTPLHLAFDTFRRAAQFRFLMVDSKLKDDCFELARIGEPLNRILEDLA